MFAFLIPMVLVSCKSRHDELLERVEKLRSQAQVAEERRTFARVLGSTATSFGNDDIFSLDNISLTKEASSGEEDSVQRLRLDFLLTYLEKGLIDHAESMAINASATPVVRDSLARVLGYPGYPFLLQRTYDIDFAEWKSKAGTTLQKSTEVYEHLLEEIRRQPVKRERTLAHLDRFFIPETLFQHVSTLVRDIGRDSKNPEYLRVASAGSTSHRWRIPEEVLIEVPPPGGFSRYATVLGIAGQAMYWANIRERSFEFMHAGDPSIDLVYAYLFRSLVANPAWMRSRTRLPVDVIKDCSRLQAEAMIIDLRALSHTILGLPLEPVTTSVAYSAEWKSRFPPEVAMRSMLLAAQFNAHLTRSFGANWFENPAGGEFLRMVWAHGSKFSSTSLARAIGVQSIGAEEFLAHVKFLLLSSTKPSLAAARRP